VIGQVLGHCRIVSKIGEGGMGVVYRAYDEVLHRDVALKVVKKDGRLDTSSSQSLLHEARASSSLAHPKIRTIHEVGESEGELYIVMELVGFSVVRSAYPGLYRGDSIPGELFFVCDLGRTRSELTRGVARSPGWSAGHATVRRVDSWAA
jgi:eukaryotic-like serine/threonine-protein kinase